MAKRRNLAIVLVLFALIVGAGAVWAATSGVLDFGGTVNLSESVDLDIVNPQFSGNGVGSGSLSNSNNTYTFTVDLSDPGDVSTLTFDVENVGNVEAEITGVTLTDLSGQLVGGVTLGGTYGTLNGQKILTGASINGKTVTVTWNSNALNASGSDTFAVTVDYAAVQ